MRSGLPYQKWDVYERALELCERSREIAAPLPQDDHLADQLLRAADSIPLNISEGAGEFSVKEKARFYRMAKRSAFECSSALSIIEQAHRHRSNREELDRAAIIAQHIIRSLTALIRKISD